MKYLVLIVGTVLWLVGCAVTSPPPPPQGYGVDCVEEPQ
jgi:hypothetical protein